MVSNAHTQRPHAKHQRPDARKSVRSSSKLRRNWVTESNKKGCGYLWLLPECRLMKWRVQKPLKAQRNIHNLGATA